MRILGRCKVANFDSGLTKRARTTTYASRGIALNKTQLRVDLMSTKNTTMDFDELAAVRASRSTVS